MAHIFPGFHSLQSVLLLQDMINRCTVIIHAKSPHELRPEIISDRGLIIFVSLQEALVKLSQHVVV